MSSGAPGRGFPSTKYSAVVRTSSEDSNERRYAFEILIAAYWKPVYRYIRLKWNKSTEDAKDLTQGFFTTAFEKNFFRSYDSQKARFRTFLRTCLEGYLSNEAKAAARLKRGGEMQFVSMDFHAAEHGIKDLQLPAGDSLEDYFHKEWVRSIFELALEEFERECRKQGKLQHYRIFERYDLDEEDLTYEKLAAELNISPLQVTNYLAFARREFRRIVLETLRQITGSEQEFRQEARSLLGIDAP